MVLLCISRKLILLMPVSVCQHRVDAGMSISTQRVVVILLYVSMQLMLVIPISVSRWRILMMLVSVYHHTDDTDLFMSW
jgi:hypothetical protein